MAMGRVNRDPSLSGSEQVTGILTQAGFGMGRGLAYPIPSHSQQIYNIESKTYLNLRHSAFGKQDRFLYIHINTWVLNILKTDRGGYAFEIPNLISRYFRLPSIRQYGVTRKLKYLSISWQNYFDMIAKYAYRSVPFFFLLLIQI